MAISLIPRCRYLLPACATYLAWPGVLPRSPGAFRVFFGIIPCSGTHLACTLHLASQCFQYYSTCEQLTSITQVSSSSTGCYSFGLGQACFCVALGPSEFSPASTASNDVQRRSLLQAWPGVLPCSPGAIWWSSHSFFVTGAHFLPCYLRAWPGVLPCSPGAFRFFLFLVRAVSSMHFCYCSHSVLHVSGPVSGLPLACFMLPCNQPFTQCSCNLFLILCLSSGTDMTALVSYEALMPTTKFFRIPCRF